MPLMTIFVGSLYWLLQCLHQAWRVCAVYITELMIFCSNKVVVIRSTQTCELLAYCFVFPFVVDNCVLCKCLTFVF